jgi:drug/metabolite transporter (DMT)-like permease
MDTRTVAAFLLVAALWGTAFMVTKAGLAWIPPVLFAAYRFDVAAAVLLGLALWRGERLRPTGPEWRPILTGGVLLVGVHHAFLFAGQQYVTSAVAAVLLGLIPVLTPALVRLSTSAERLSPVGLLGVGLGFAGVVTIANPDPSNLAAADLRGVALVLGSAITFAVGAVGTHDAPTTMPTVSEQAWMMLVGAVTLHATSAALPTESLADPVWTPTAVASLAYLAVVAGAGGFALYFWLLRRVGPIQVSLLEYVIPIFAAVSGWLALGEALSRQTVLGFGIIVVGFVLVKRRALRAELRRWRDDRIGPSGTE